MTPFHSRVPALLALALPAAAPEANVQDAGPAVATTAVRDAEDSSFRYEPGSGTPVLRLPRSERLVRPSGAAASVMAKDLLAALADLATCCWARIWS